MNDKSSVALVCMGLLLAFAGPLSSQAMTSCQREPWLSPCEPIVMSREGVQTLRLIGTKVELIRDLDGITEAAGFVDLLQQADAVLRLPPAQGLGGYRIALNVTNTFLQAAEALRPRLQRIGWMAIRRDIEHHLASLAGSRQDNSPEGRFFARLLATMEHEPDPRIEEHDRRRREWQSAWDQMVADAAAYRSAFEEYTRGHQEYSRDVERLRQRQAAARQESEAVRQLSDRIRNTPRGPNRDRMYAEWQRRRAAHEAEVAEMVRVREGLVQRYEQGQRRQAELEQWYRRGSQQRDALRAEDEALKALQREIDGSGGNEQSLAVPLPEIR